MSQQGKAFKQRYYPKINTLSLCRPELLSSNANLIISQQGKVFKQRYYRNINKLIPCRRVLLSDNLQSYQVTAGEMVQKTILSEP